MSDMVTSTGEARSFLERAFAKLFDPLATERDILEFFSPEYRQDLNGKLYSFRQFLDGVSEIKASIKSSRIVFTSVVSAGETIAEVHVVDAVRKDGTRLRFKVIAFQTMAGGRIVKAEEVNCPLPV
ncbi:MAG: nuclear transport factor 2 family protein [Nitrososphaerales archaeon]